MRGGAVAGTRLTWSSDVRHMTFLGEMRAAGAAVRKKAAFWDQAGMSRRALAVLVDGNRAVPRFQRNLRPPAVAVLSLEMRIPARSCGRFLQRVRLKFRV